MVSFVEVFKTLADNKIFSRVTASGAVGYSLYTLAENITAANPQPEIIALFGTIAGSAATFLFMSEKD